MARNKPARIVPEERSILEASEFWDEHSLLDFPDTTQVSRADIQIEREVYYCPVSVLKPWLISISRKSLPHSN